MKYVLILVIKYQEFNFLYKINEFNKFNWRKS